MAKDPAFLFYPGDWMGGTATFSRAHKGAYMDLLMAQFNCGHLSVEDIQFILGPDYQLMWENKLKSKFKEDSEGKFYNEKLDSEIDRRKKFTESRRKNLSHIKPHMETHVGSQMETETETETEEQDRGMGKGDGKRLWDRLLKTAYPTFDLFKPEMEKYADGKYLKYDLPHYYQIMMNWSESGKKMKKNWMATCATFISRDIDDGKPKMAKKPQTEVGTW